MNMIGLFDVEQTGRTVVLVPRGDVDEFSFDEIEADVKGLFQLLGNARAQNVVVDFNGIDHCGSTALGFFIKLWKRVRDIGGGMAFCNVSDHVREIFELTNLDKVWTVCGSRAEAIAAVEE